MFRPKNNLFRLTLINKRLEEPRLPASSKIIVPLNKKWSVLMGLDLHYTFAPFLTLNCLIEFVGKKRMKNYQFFKSEKGTGHLLLCEIDETKTTRAHSARENPLLLGNILNTHNAI